MVFFFDIGGVKEEMVIGCRVVYYKLIFLRFIGFVSGKVMEVIKYMNLGFRR